MDVMIQVERKLRSGKSGDSPRKLANSVAGDQPVNGVSPSESLAVVEKGRRLPTLVEPANMDERRLRNTMKYLVDPLKFTEHVRLLLGKNDVPTAYALLQYASKSMNCVVAWNSLILWCFENDRINPALKIYNEVCRLLCLNLHLLLTPPQMKKRAQWPDSYTYRHLLQGLAKLSRYPSSVPKALSIFHSMFADNARTRPTTIHLNMMLKCCARTGDMDSLWGVTSKIDNKGIKPDRITYSIILNALQRNAMQTLEAGSTNEETAWHFDIAVEQGRRIWVDVVAKWQEMELVVDDTLVCAMGRLLLLSWRPRDWDDIFSLLLQAEGIPRVVPPLGTEGRKRADAYLNTPTLDNPGAPAAMMNDVANVALRTRGSEFYPVQAPRTGDFLFSPPTNNTLSLVLETCLKLVSKRVADEYWQIFTKSKKYGIRPDSDNFHHYLRILRQHKASGKALRLVRDDMKDMTLENAKRREDYGAVEHANDLVLLMSERLTSPDFHSLTMYLKLVADREEHEALIKAIRNVESVLAKHINWKDQEDIQEFEGDARAQFSDLCRSMLDSIRWLEQKRHVLHESTDGKAWRFTKRKLETCLRRLDTKQLKAATKANGSLLLESINARNVHKALRQPTELPEVEFEGQANYI